MNVIIAHTKARAALLTGLLAAGIAAGEPLQSGAGCGVVDPVGPGPWRLSPSMLKSAGQNLLADGFESDELRIVFHVIEAADGTGHLADEQVLDQLALIKVAYEGLDTRKIVLDAVNRIVDERYFTRCLEQPIWEELTERYAVTPARTVNVYSCLMIPPFVVGMATFPWEYPADSPLRGVRVSYQTFPGEDLAPYNQGATLVHEIGHYFGLLHTFAYGCEAPGDGVADTVAEASPAYGCPVGRDSCPGGGADPVTNFMNYSDDACMTDFTPGQFERIRYYLDVAVRE